MDKIWVVRGCHIGEDGAWNVGFFKTEDAAFKKRDECKKEADEDDFDPADHPGCLSFSYTPKQQLKINNLFEAIEKANIQDGEEIPNEILLEHLTGFFNSDSTQQSQ